MKRAQNVDKMENVDNPWQFLERSNQFMPRGIFEKEKFSTSKKEISTNLTVGKLVEICG